MRWRARVPARAGVVAGQGERESGGPVVHAGRSVEPPRSGESAQEPFAECPLGSFDEIPSGAGEVVERGGEAGQ
jgi:hypothetical protein